MGRHRFALRAARRTNGRRRARANSGRRVGARGPGLALGQVRVRGRPGPAAGRPRPRRRLLPQGGADAQPAGRARARSVCRNVAAVLPAGTGRRTQSCGDHGARPGLDQGGTAGDRRVLPRPRPRHPRSRRTRPGRVRIRAADRARLREGRHGGGGLPGRPQRHRLQPGRSVRREPGRLLRRPRRRLRAAASRDGGVVRALPFRPALGRPAAADQGHPPAPLPGRERRGSARPGRRAHPRGRGEADHPPAARRRRRARRHHPRQPPRTHGEGGAGR